MKQFIRDLPTLMTDLDYIEVVSFVPGPSHYEQVRRLRELGVNAYLTPKVDNGNIINDLMSLYIHKDTMALQALSRIYEFDQYQTENKASLIL